MTVFAPTSGTVSAAGDDHRVFIGPAVTLSGAGIVINLEGSGHRVEIFGAVASTAATAVWLGLSLAAPGHTVAIGAGAFLRGFVGSGLLAYGSGTRVTNDGDIYGSAYGVALSGSTATSTLINTGKITSDFTGVLHGGNNAFELQNSGLVQGGTFQFSFDGSDGIDRITNTGRMVWDIQLRGGNDTYNGASGRLTGNIYGGAGNDTITGGVEHDWFEGGNDNDTLRGNGGNDTLFGDAGNDMLYGGIGNDSLEGWTGVDTLFGDAGNDILKGEAGNDKLNGGLGNDKLYGGANNDVFVFNAPLVAANRDTIYDFNRPGDTIHLENAIFKALTKVGVLNKDFFKLGTKATDANDHIIYNKANGALYYDPDGTGAAAQIQFATLANKAAITNADFVVI